MKITRQSALDAAREDLARLAALGRACRDAQRAALCLDGMGAPADRARLHDARRAAELRFDTLLAEMAVEVLDGAGPVQRDLFDGEGEA